MPTSSTRRLDFLVCMSCRVYRTLDLQIFLPTDVPIAVLALVALSTCCRSNIDFWLSIRSYIAVLYSKVHVINGSIHFMHVSCMKNILQFSSENLTDSTSAAQTVEKNSDTKPKSTLRFLYLFKKAYLMRILRSIKSTSLIHYLLSFFRISSALS